MFIAKEELRCENARSPRSPDRQDRASSQRPDDRLRRSRPSPQTVVSSRVSVDEILANQLSSRMRWRGSRWTIASAFAAALACASPTPSSTRTPTAADIPIEEIEGPVAPPGPRVVDATGARQPGAKPHELRTAGDYYYRANEFDRAYSLYMACFGSADGELRAACLWAAGATLVILEHEQVKEDRARERELRRRLGLSAARRECSSALPGLGGALSTLRLAYRLHSTARRALVIAALYESEGVDVEALRFYERARSLAPNDPIPSRAIAQLRGGEASSDGHSPGEVCQPRDCPELPFGWHHRSGDLEVLGSGLEGSSRDRTFACFGEPREVSGDSWVYSRSTCQQTSEPSEPGTSQHIVTTIRLHFEGDIVERVTHERVVEDRDRGCTLWVGY